MKLTDSEKLILIMLSEVHEKLGIEGGLNPKFVREAIYGGHDWAFEWEYPGLFPERVDESFVREVTDILDMWTFIEEAGGEQFPGFDGNREGTHASVADFMTDELDRFSRLKGRVRHGVLGLDGYRRMYEKFEPIRASLGDRNPPRLTKSEVDEILAERVHPANR